MRSNRVPRIPTARCPECNKSSHVHLKQEESREPGLWWKESESGCPRCGALVVVETECWLNGAAEWVMEKMKSIKDTEKLLNDHINNGISDCRRALKEQKGIHLRIPRVRVKFEHWDEQERIVDFTVEIDQ